MVWYLGSPPRLGPLARHAFAEAVAGRAKIVIPVIVLAEIIFVVERGRIRALATILRLQTLTEILEMHDRILVAEALARKASLITRDQAITNSRIVATVW